MVVVRDVFRHDPFGGHLFVFFSKRCERVRIVYWARNGFAITSPFAPDLVQVADVRHRYRAHQAARGSATQAVRRGTSATSSTLGVDAAVAAFGANL